MLAISASIIIISGIVATLVKWEDIKDIEIDMNKNQLKSFTNTKTINRIYPAQYYSLEDIDEISKFQKTKSL